MSSLLAEWKHWLRVHVLARDPFLLDSMHFPSPFGTFYYERFCAAAYAKEREQPWWTDLGGEA